MEVALRSRGGLAIAAVLALAGCSKKQEPPLPASARASGNAIIVSHRTRTGEQASLERVERDGSSRWRVEVPRLQPDARSFVADARLVVAAARPDASAMKTTLLAFDADSGKERWRAAPGDGIETLWLFGDAVVARTSGNLLVGYGAADGKERWRTKRVAGEYAPQAFGNLIVAPLEHARPMPLLVVDLARGPLESLSTGFVWPGATVGDAFVARFFPGRSSSSLVTPLLLATADAGTNPPSSGAVTPSATRPSIVTIGPNGALTVGESIREDCEKATFFSRYQEKTICDVDGVLRIGSSELRAPDGYRFWGGGATHAEWLARESWPFGSPTVRWVPMVLNGKNDAAKLCLVDLDTAAFAWCAARDITNIDIYGWLHMTSRGRWHFVHLLVAGNREALAVFDGTTGKLHMAVSRARISRTEMSAWPFADDVLAITGGDEVVTLDLRTKSGGWTRAAPRAPAAAGWEEARRAVEDLIGPLP